MTRNVTTWASLQSSAGVFYTLALELFVFPIINLKLDLFEAENAGVVL